jgi:thioredoxin 1
MIIILRSSYEKGNQMTPLVIEANDTNFEVEVLKASRPVLVDFWAAWCGPCRAIAPAVQSIAEKYQGKAKVVKVNVDENPDTPARYGIKGIPTLILFRDGKEVERLVGVPGNAAGHLSQLLDRHLTDQSKPEGLPGGGRSTDGTGSTSERLR